MTRTCVDEWIIRFTEELVKMFLTREACRRLFDINLPNGGCLFDALTDGYRKSDGENWYNIRQRVHAILRYGDDMLTPEEVRAVLSM